MIDYQYKNIEIKAEVAGGQESIYIIKPYNIAFDIGRAPHELIHIPTIFLSHGHLDHSSGLPYYYSQRALRHMKQARVYVPHQIYEPLNKIIELWHEIEGFRYEPGLVALSPGDTVELGQNHYVKALKAYHRVPALGYVLFRVVKKLKREYLDLASNVIRKKKQAGEDIFEIKHIPELAYSGDTSFEWVLNHKDVQDARLLILECTYIDQKKPREHARQWGHIHLDEIAEHAPIFSNERVVLTHLSRRYKPSFIADTLKQKIPSGLYDRLDFVY